MRSEVEGVFLRLNPWDLRGPALRGRPDRDAGRRARAPPRGGAVFAEEIGKSFSLDLSDLSRDQWSLVPPIGDFLAEMRTSRFGTLDLRALGRRARGHHACSIASAAATSPSTPRRPSWPTRGSRFYSEEDDADYDVAALQHPDLHRSRAVSGSTAASRCGCVRVPSRWARSRCAWPSRWSCGR